MPAVANKPSLRPSSSLSPLEVQAVEIFINFTRLLRWPKSVGEIYGVLFVASRPLAMDEIIDRLGLSLGAVSQGLKMLRQFGAVQVSYRPGVRKDYYIASGELSRLAVSCLEEEILPRMSAATERIDRLQPLLESLPAEDRQLPAERLVRLRYWLQRGQEAFPLLTRILDAG